MIWGFESSTSEREVKVWQTGLIVRDDNNVTKRFMKIIESGNGGRGFPYAAAKS